MFESAKDRPLVQVGNVQRLRCISGCKKITIPASGGALPKTRNVFTGGIGSNFNIWDIRRASKPAEEQAVEIHELILDGTFKLIYKSLNTDLGNLCFTQDQIENFCANQESCLRRDGGCNFFLFKKDDEKPATEDNLFVAAVDVYNDKTLSEDVFRFSDEGMWYAEYAHRFIVPSEFSKNGFEF